MRLASGSKLTLYYCVFQYYGEWLSPFVGDSATTNIYTILIKVILKSIHKCVPIHIICKYCFINNIWKEAKTGKRLSWDQWTVKQLWLALLLNDRAKDDVARDMPTLQGNHCLLSSYSFIMFNESRSIGLSALTNLI